MRKDIEKIGGYRENLEKHGVTPMGVSWKDAPGLATRFEVLLSGANLDARDARRPLRLLDLGCGPGFLLDWLALNGQLEKVAYTGVDVNEQTMQHARTRWPNHRFEIRDVRDRPFAPNEFDYCVACGVFTGKGENTQEEMLDLVKDTLTTVWPSVELGLAFNVMSKHVDWERDHCFHWALDDIMSFCKRSLSRHVSFRLDYDLWETAVIVLRNPVDRTSKVPQQWMGPSAQPK